MATRATPSCVLREEGPGAGLREGKGQGKLSGGRIQDRQISLSITQDMGLTDPSCRRLRTRIPLSTPGQDYQVTYTGKNPLVFPLQVHRIYYDLPLSRAKALIIMWLDSRISFSRREGTRMRLYNRVGQLRL